MNERLKQLRILLNLTQKEFAERLLVSSDLISAVERGKRNLTDRTLHSICGEFGVSMNWLVTGEGDIFIDIFDNIEADEDVKETTKKLLQLDEVDRSVILSMVELLIKKNKN